MLVRELIMKMNKAIMKYFRKIIKASKLMNKEKESNSENKKCSMPKN